jgi:uncharacterized OsmC-like protein
MGTLNEYLAEKRQKLRQRRAELAKRTDVQPHALHAETTAEGRSGIRRIRIRDFQVILDSGPELAGYNLGPSSPELQLGVLSSCLTHIFLIQAADLEVPLDSLRVEVNAVSDPRARRPEFPEFADVPIYPHDITYTVHIQSPAPAEQIKELHEAVERTCPIFNLLRDPQEITGRVVLNEGAEELAETSV